MNSIELKSAEKGTPFSGVYVVRNISKKAAKNGKPFFNIEVGDRLGSFVFNVFENHAMFNLIPSLEIGSFLQLDGCVDFYNDRLSPNIMAIKTLTPEDIHERHLESQLIAGPKESLELLRAEFNSYVERIDSPELRQTIANALEEVGDLFWENTAAVSMHHAYQHGLLEHSVHVTRAGFSLLPHYPFIKKDLAITGMLLHDIGKCLEYKGEVAFERTRLGLLQGHVVLGYRIVRKAALQAKLDEDTLTQLEHIILCHQGLLEYGAAVLPSSPEGVFVSLIDNLDARMAMVDRALDTTPKNDEFSEKILGLENVRVFTGCR